MTDPTTTPPVAPAAPATLSEAMTLIADEHTAAGTPVTSGAALQALAETRFPDLIGKP